jgi:hypothetical protein
MVALDIAVAGRRGIQPGEVGDSSMALTAAQIEARNGKLTASRVACLMKGDPVAIMRLYREMIGEQAEEDLSDVWAVQLGSVTEQLNLDWYQRNNTPVTRRGEVVAACDWAAATLDGWDDFLKCPIECKHVGGFEPLEIIVERYQPQMHWQMICTKTRQCVLSVIMGAREPLIEVVPRDNIYALELWKRGFEFMECVRRRVPPVALPEIAAPVDPTKVYDFTGKNIWAAQAADWLANREGARVAKAAEAALKEIVPADAKKVTGHGVRVTRDKAGRLSLRVDE